MRIKVEKYSNYTTKIIPIKSTFSKFLFVIKFQCYFYRHCVVSMERMGLHPEARQDDDQTKELYIKIRLIWIRKSNHKTLRVFLFSNNINQRKLLENTFYRMSLNKYKICHSECCKIPNIVFECIDYFLLPLSTFLTYSPEICLSITIC